MTLGTRSILNKAINTYGATNQEDVAIEEMSELTKAILKCRRAAKENSNDLPRRTKDLIEEIADIKIMIEQLIMINSLSDNNFERKVNGEITWKIARLNDRLEG